MSVRLTIFGQMKQVAREHGKVLLPLRDELALIDCGLDSLGLAVLIARLEDTLSIDPFTDADGPSFPTTLGEFVKAYENNAR